MCNCIKDVSEKLDAHLRAKVKPNDVDSFEHSGFDNECFMLNKSPNIGTAIGIPYSIGFYRKKKDGSRAQSLTKLKTNLFMSYCPMCGEKYPE
jgi:hypothetical protein